MPDIARAQRLLALFTSPDRAEAIAGDLTEGLGNRGSIVFWWNVLATVAALWGRTLTSAPLPVLGLAAAGGLLFGSSAFGGVAAVSLFPPLVTWPVSWMAVSVFWWGCALGTGAWLVTVAPIRGMATCVVIALIVEALLLAVWLTVLRHESLTASLIVVYSGAVLAAAPLLMGGAIARRWILRRGSLRLERGR